MAESEERRSRMAMFCKEKKAIVKKADEICTLCVANVVVIICFTICGQMHVYGDETIIDAFENETIAAPQCTFNCTIHKPPRFFKLQKWRNNGNNSSSGSSSHDKKKGQIKIGESPINPPANMDEFTHKLVLPQLQDFLGKMEGFKEVLGEQYQFLRAQQNVFESSSAMA